MKKIMSVLLLLCMLLALLPVAALAEEELISVKFMRNDETEEVYTTVAVGETGLFTVPEETPTREGWSFTGWAMSPEEAVCIYPGNEMEHTEGNSTFYAIWEENSNSPDENDIMLLSGGNEPVGGENSAPAGAITLGTACAIEEGKTYTLAIETAGLYSLASGTADAFTSFTLQNASGTDEKIFNAITAGIETQWWLETGNYTMTVDSCAAGATLLVALYSSATGFVANVNDVEIDGEDVTISASYTAPASESETAYTAGMGCALEPYSGAGRVWQMGSEKWTSKEWSNEYNGIVFFIPGLTYYYWAFIRDGETGETLAVSEAKSFTAPNISYEALTLDSAVTIGANKTNNFYSFSPSASGTYALSFGESTSDNLDSYDIFVYNSKGVKVAMAVNASARFAATAGEAYYICAHNRSENESQFTLSRFTAPDDEPSGEPDNIRTDDSTGVTVEVPEDEKDKIAGLVFVASPLPDDKETLVVTVIGKQMSGKVEKSYVLDIHFANAVTGEEVEVGGQRTVTVPIPEGWDAKNTMVLFVDTETGRVENMRGTVSADGKTISFTASHFSYYALVQMESEPSPAPTPEATPAASAAPTASAAPDNTAERTQTQSPKTGDEAKLALWMVLLCASVLLVPAAVQRRKQK